MPERREDLLAGTDQPRPLPPALRRRLEQRLLAGTDPARPPDPELSARLADGLSDPVAVLLADVDGPRELPARLRRRLHAQLVRRPWRQGRRLVAAAAAVVALAGAGFAINWLTRSSATSKSTTAAPAPTTSQRTPTEPGGAAASGAGPPAAASPKPPATPTAAPLIIPVEGPTGGGNWVTITGSGFFGTTTVRFDQTAATALEVVSDGELLVVAPAHPPGIVDIIAVSPAGTRWIARYSYMP
jgi:hypothetical protein